MKIAITSDLYAPMINGVAVFAQNLAKGLAQRGHEVMVICPSFKGKKYQEVEAETGLIIQHVSSVRFPFYPDQINQVPKNKEILGKVLPRVIYKNGIWIAPYPYPELKRALVEFQPDVIHNQTAEMVAVAALGYARKYGVPLVSTGHAYPDNITGQLKLLKPMKRPLDVVLRAYMASFLKNSEYATMPTEVAIEDLVKRNNRKFKVPVEAISNGIDLTKFVAGEPKKEILEKYGLDVQKKRVLYVGRVDPEKSIDKVILAFRRIAENEYDGKETEMVIVGDGVSKGKLEKMAEELGLGEYVKFLGKITGDELVELYKTGDVFVTASKTETQGIVLVEAAAMGLPIVAVDAGAVREICQDERNGVLCESSENVVMELTRGIDLILGDEQKRKKMSEESKEIAQKHDLNKTLQRFEEIYQMAVDLKNND